MDLRKVVHLASISPIKSTAAKKVFKTVFSYDAKSGVSHQPIGRTETLQGAKNRLNCVTGVFPVIAYESGLIYKKDGSVSDRTYGILRTNMGDFYALVEHDIKNIDKLHQWEASDRKLTFGAYAYPTCHADWYGQDVVEPKAADNTVATVPNQLADNKAADIIVANAPNQLVDNKAADNKAADNKAADNKAADNKAADNKAATPNQLVDNKAVNATAQIVEAITGEQASQVTKLNEITQYLKFMLNKKPRSKSRASLLTLLTNILVEKYEAFVRSLPVTVIPAPTVNFKDVNFLDLQYPLSKYSANLSEITYRLSNNLLFNKVAVLDARGFLLTGEFARQNYPIILLRKPGKLPTKELSVEYKKEYGTDVLCMSEGYIGPGDKIIVIDDVIATGGTMRAAEKLINKAGGDVVAFIAPFAIVTERSIESFLMGTPDKKIDTNVEKTVINGTTNSDINRETVGISDNKTDIDNVNDNDFSIDNSDKKTITTNNNPTFVINNSAIDVMTLEHTNEFPVVEPLSAITTNPTDDKNINFIAVSNKVISTDSAEGLDLMSEIKFDQLLCRSLSIKCRYLCTQIQANKAANSTSDSNPKVINGTPNMSILEDSALIFPPSLYAYDILNLAVPMKWGRFARSSNIWFKADCIKSKHVILCLDPSNSEEFLNSLQLLQILHRKDPLSVTAIIPFLEQSTQDRVEYDGKGWESLASIDTFAKIMGKTKILTFDLHSEQTKFAFHDLRFENLVALLCEKYFEVNDAVAVFPDDGAAKRYSKILNDVPHITFRKIRDGDKRIVATDAKIEGKKYAIIDDLVRSGGTMNEVAKHLLANGAISVDAIFAHAPFEPAAAKNMSIFNDVWTTNTCLSTAPREWVKIDIYKYMIEKFTV